MLILVVGGSASGKSEFAENTAVSFGGRRIYAATMRPLGAASKKRIENHRLRRRDKGFETVERFTDIGALEVSGTVLLEDAGNLVLNEMFSGNGENDAASIAERIAEGLKRLNGKCENLVVVSDNVFEELRMYDDMTEKYINIAGTVNIRAAAFADRVYEVVCGIPTLIYSGEDDKK